LVNYFGAATCNSGCQIILIFLNGFWWPLILLNLYHVKYEFNINWFGFYYFKLS
jgi:hypothetical protein